MPTTIMNIPDDQIELEVELSETHITIKIPLLDEPQLSSTGKSYIIARVAGWTKTDIKDGVTGRKVILAPLTIISK